MNIKDRGYETTHERYKRLLRDVTFFLGVLSSGAGIYVLGTHLLNGEFGAIGRAVWAFVSNFSNLWYEVASFLLEIEFGQTIRNLISLYFIFGVTAARAWYIFSLERPIEIKIKRNRIYWDAEDEFVSETVVGSELRHPFAVSVILPFTWPVLLPLLYHYHDGGGSSDFEDIPDPREHDGKSDYRYVIFTTRASYRKLLICQIIATLTIGLFVLSADALF